jgi:hypothetical protein
MPHVIVPSYRPVITPGSRRNCPAIAARCLADKAELAHPDTRFSSESMYVEGRALVWEEPIGRRLSQTYVRLLDGRQVPTETQIHDGSKSIRALRRAPPYVPASGDYCAQEDHWIPGFRAAALGSLVEIEVSRDCVRIAARTAIP